MRAKPLVQLKLSGVWAVGGFKGHLPLARTDDSVADEDVVAQLVLSRATPAEVATMGYGVWRKSALAQPIAPSEWSALELMAHRTLVPASDASRAGAGSTAGDND